MSFSYPKCLIFTYRVCVNLVYFHDDFTQLGVQNYALPLSISLRPSRLTFRSLARWLQFWPKGKGRERVLVI